MKTFSAKPAEVTKKWVLIDAKGLVVGRLATIVAMRLRGKHLPTYTPHVDCGDNVIIINAAACGAHRPQARAEDLLQAHRLSSATSRSAPRARSSRARFPERVLEKAVERMIPRGPLGRVQMGNLRVYRRRRASARGPDAREDRYRQVEPQEHEGRIIMAETIQSLDQLSQLKTGGARSAQAREEGRQVQPRLRHRQAQGRGRPRLDQAGRRQGHRQHRARSRSISPVPCCA